MQLDAVQNRIVKSKPIKFSLLKGKSGSGKTTTALYRTLYLKNNYCLYDDDKVLILTKDSTKRDALRDMYNKIEDETRADYRTLFTNNLDRVDVLTTLDILNRFYFEYTNANKKCFKILQEDSEKDEIIKTCTKLLRREYGAINLLNDKYLNFFKEEIAWMKACSYGSLEVYQNVDRIGRRAKRGEGPQRLLKNSKERSIIFNLYEAYNEKLNEKGFIDYEDISIFALDMASKGEHNRYTHIIVDEAENLSKVHIDFIRNLLDNKIYSSIMFTINSDENIKSNGWFIQGRKLCNLELDGPMKNHILKKIYREAAEGVLQMNGETKVKSFMECFEYYDLKHHKKYDFKRDPGINDIVYVENGNEDETINADGLRGLPVYSDIAAGEPIMMHDELEAEFNIPQYFVTGSRESFILKVRGDSMINANIFDGDYVVIRKQSTAINGDLVAVDLDGSATLKRLSIKKNIPILMPENEKYDPIFMHDKEAAILGIVVGVLKNKQ